ncbi:MAG: GTPase Era [Campylobacterota bacterium]
MEHTTETKAGFIAVLGRPNAGKSTLLNFLAGQKLAMVSKKVQATRKRMNIIIEYENTQQIYVDTPGIHEREKLLNQFMMEEVIKAMGDCDLTLFLQPVHDDFTEYEKFLRYKKDHIVVLTKVDEVGNDVLLQKLDALNGYGEHFLEVVPVSIKQSGSRDHLLKTVAKHLPASPFLFESDFATTATIRDIYKELIREAIFDQLSDELPYESDVLIEKIDEKEDMDRVYATVIVEKPSQKGMVIGKNAATIKRIGASARRKLQEFSQKRIYLDLMVSVKKGWSKQKDLLADVGYIVD